MKYRKQIDQVKDKTHLDDDYERKEIKKLYISRSQKSFISIAGDLKKNVSIY